MLAKRVMDIGGSLIDGFDAPKVEVDCELDSHGGNDETE
jgi:hypothetical protein